MRKPIILVAALVFAGLTVHGHADGGPGQPYSDDFEFQESAEVLLDSLNVDCLGRGLYGPCWAVYVKGYYAYVGGGGCLLIIDITDRVNPVLVGSIYTPGLVWGIRITGGHAYIANGEGGLRIINVEDPSNPYEEGFYDTGGYARGVYALGKYAYVADGREGLRIINVSDPLNPYEEGFYDTGGEARAVTVKEDYAY